ncbi:hypothetical protein SEA_CHASER_135 [Mycobacterium phage Chaser]|nr:hypothetical protein SEA_CHASER_135 [Mycobacterium phage Chaser]
MLDMSTTKPQPPKFIGVGICALCNTGGKRLLKGHICQDCVNARPKSTGVAGIYPGGLIWGVRWQPYGPNYEHEVIRCNTEADARSFHSTLTTVNQVDAELVAARITWTVQK